MHDLAVIGAGVVGLSVARRLALRGLDVIVLEADHDVGRGASGRNSGVVHPGFSVNPGTRKARLCVEGARLMRLLCDELSVPLVECGTLVVAMEPEEEAYLHQLVRRGQANGLDRLVVVSGDELADLEPAVIGHAAFFAPQGAIIDPQLLVVRLADECVSEGAEIELLCPVEGLERAGDHWLLQTARGARAARMIINAAGVRAPEVSAMAGAETYDSHPCRGQYLVLDEEATGVPTRTVYPVAPKTGGLGVHFTPSIGGNTLVGPSAEYVDLPADFSTTAEVLALLSAEARALAPGFQPRDVITSFAGTRAKIGRGAYGSVDFVIGSSVVVEGLVNLVGIESPGLTAAPAIALEVERIVLDRLGDRPLRLAAVAPHRPSFARASEDDRVRRVTADRDEGELTCRCEQVTRAEVLHALHNPLQVRSVSGLKARTRATTGRCQGSFCIPRIVRIMKQDLGMQANEVRLTGPGSEMLAGDAKRLLL